VLDWFRRTPSDREKVTAPGFPADTGEQELAASLDPAEVTERVLSAVVALRAVDAALLIVNAGSSPASGEARPKVDAIGLNDAEAERAALETPPNTNLRSMEVVYRYRLDEAGERSRLPRAALVVPLRAGERAIGSLSAITRENPHSFPPETASELEGLARRAGPAIANAQRFAEATQLAELDPLTGLANRRVFHELLAREVARSRRYGRRLSVIVVDLDDFKRINDRIGHLGGDAVLAEVAGRLRAVVRSTDHACRVGGDEFAVILPESTRGDADHLAARIERAVGVEPIPKAGTMKVSAGVAELSPDDTPTDLFERADEDLYRAKASVQRATR
jgi:diguanylate cyclase (GGDEF)-like protein